MQPLQLAIGRWLINHGLSYPRIRSGVRGSHLLRILRLLILLVLGFTLAASALPLSVGGDGVAISGLPRQTAPNQLLPPIDEGMCPGEVYPFQLTIYLPRTPPKGDIVFVFDTTGSMGGVIYAAQQNAMIIMDDLSRLISDVQFGVIDVEDYPLDPYGVPGINEPYRLRQPLTDDRNAVRLAIDALSANQGGDLPEAYTRAIHEAYADSRIGWRENSRALLLLFGDSVSHDDDLNAGIPYPQPYHPGRPWETGWLPSYLDPGRDGVPGTADDLDFQAELAQLAEQDITLLVVVTSSTFPKPTQSDLVTYWNVWTAPTGGKAVPLWNAGDLPELIRHLVEETIVGIIRRMTLETEPEIFESWVVFDPAEINDIVIPSDGALSFLGRVEAPVDASPGTYQFRIIAVGDGIVYGEKQVTITVPEECFTDPTFPTWYYLPLITHGYAGTEPEGPGQLPPYPEP